MSIEVVTEEKKILLSFSLSRSLFISVHIRDQPTNEALLFIHMGLCYPCSNSYKLYSYSTFSWNFIWNLFPSFRGYTCIFAGWKFIAGKIFEWIVFDLLPSHSVANCLSYVWLLVLFELNIFVCVCVYAFSPCILVLQLLFFFHSLSFDTLLIK